AFVATSCGRVAPTSPSLTSQSDENVSSTADPNATGQVVGIGSLSTGISNVVISGGGVLNARTDARGFFTLNARTSTYALTLTHPDFVERRTAVKLPASGVHVSMMPSTFDQAAFEELAPRATATGLRRWTQDPSLTVLTNVVEYDGVAYAPLVTDRGIAEA